MGMLGRYKKAGGFCQLLNLIETCEPPKRNNFLKMIEGEDINWARAIKMKMLTMDRISDWEDPVLGKIATQIPEDVFAVLSHEYDQLMNSRMLPSLSQGRKDRISKMKEKGEPTEKELTRAVIQFITEVRRILNDGTLPVESIDATLPIPQDIEEQLMKGTFAFPKEASFLNEFTPAQRKKPKAPARPGMSAKAAAQEEVAPASGGSTDINAMQAELSELREKLTLFAYQNNRLRREIRALQAQLEKNKKSS